MPPGVLVTRPMPQAEASAARLLALGYAPVLSPMLHYEALDPPPEIDLAGVQAILLTSAHAALTLAAATSERAALILAVGDRTADTARDAGFANVRSAKGDAAALASLAGELSPEDGALLHARGAHIARSPLTALNDFETREIVLYRTVQARELSEAAANALAERRIAATLVYSPRTAEALAHCLDGVDTSAQTLVGISAAAMAPLAAQPFARRAIAAESTESALLETIAATVPSA